MSKEIEEYGVAFINGITFDATQFCFEAKIPFAGDMTVLRFNSEKHFEKLTGKNIYTFDTDDFMDLAEKYEDDYSVNINGEDLEGDEVYVFTQFNAPLKYKYELNPELDYIVAEPEVKYGLKEE